MTPRSVRRAAERKALKLARKAEKAVEQNRDGDGADASFPEQPPSAGTITVSEARLEANRANAQLSTGPNSAAGKAKSSLNAVKTGLTGRTVLLPSDDAEAYQKHLDRFFKQWTPSTDQERSLVQSIADTEWRLLRIPSLEMGIYALGHLEFAGQFATEDAAVRKSLIEAQIFLSYRKDLNNLSIQESRLRRQREKDSAELNQLQNERRERTRRESKPCAARELPSNGFEFSTVEIECNLDGVSSATAERRLEISTVAA